MSNQLPMLGFYDLTNPITIDWHIKWASEHGITSFCMFIAPHGNPPKEVNDGSMMTYYRDGFLKAKYKDRIKFSAVLDTRNYNSYENECIRDDSIEKDIEVLSKYYFNQLNYDKIDGKPVLYLFGTYYYLCDDNCKNEKERENLLKSHIESIRETAKKKNGYNVFLIGDLQIHFNKEYLIDDFDAVTFYSLDDAIDTTKYQWKTNENRKPVLIAPYNDMVNSSVKEETELLKLVKMKNKTFIPIVQQGYDNEKRFNADHVHPLIKRTNPTPKSFKEFVNGIKPLINPKLNTLLTTWNEFCEGNAIEPTKEFGFAYLDIIRDNFAIKSAGGWLPNIVPTKNYSCTEYKNWNTKIGIPGIGSLVTAVSENSFLNILVRRRETLNDKKIYKENLAI